jgi:hypothetical protein
VLIAEREKKFEIDIYFSFFGVESVLMALLNLKRERRVKLD